MRNSRRPHAIRQPSVQQIRPAGDSGILDDRKADNVGETDTGLPHREHLRSPAMRPVTLLSILLPMSGLAGCVAKPKLGGPLPVRNQHPAQLTVMHLDPADTTVLPEGHTAWRTDLAYTSLFLNGSNAQGSWFMDGEILRAALDARVGLGHGLQLGIQIAGAHASGGFLDDFIIDYHDTFGLPDQDRSTGQKEQFLVEAQQNGTSVWTVDKSAAELLDVPIHLTWQVIEPGDRKLGLALRGGFELPTGDQNHGYGNGQVDVALGAVFDYQSHGIGWNGHIQHSFAGTPRPSRVAGFSFEDVTSAALGVELPLATDLHAMVQVEWETSTLRGLGPQVAARDQALLWVGGRYQSSPEWSVEVGFGEDLVGLASPDFTAWLAFAWKPAP
ncbi:MAG: hypothetical protein ACI89X_004632 [Planctomycetota bacterium]|jgi:hypothetical protein